MNEELLIRFTYHPPKEDQPEKYAELRAKAYHLATVFGDLVPECREKELAFTKLEEAVMWANAGIARRE
jgi:hypothetical protein